SASRQTFVSGKATELAGLDLRRKLFAIANAPEGEYLDRGYSLAIESDGTEAQIVIRRYGITHRVEKRPRWRRLFRPADHASRRERPGCALCELRFRGADCRGRSRPGIGHY